MSSPKDRFITVYGRKPVLEVLGDRSLSVDKVVIADSAHGPEIHQIQQAARARQVPVERTNAERVKKLAGNGRQDQGVFADVNATRMRGLDDALDSPGSGRLQRILVLDGITTPANVGMILRTATAAGLDGIVVPQRGVASLDPLVVKASAGVAFRSPILRTTTAEYAVESLQHKGFRILGLDTEGAASLFEVDLSGRVAFVMGSESTGLTPAVRDLVDEVVSIPMPGDVESLNVSAAAAVVCFELVRRPTSR